MKLTDIGIQINNNNIRETEQALGLVFPEEYKSFLLENNGGVPQDGANFNFKIKLPDGGQEVSLGSNIQFFYSLDKVQEVAENLRADKLIGMEFFSIACDDFGNDILLCGAGQNMGTVYFADHEKVHPEGTASISYKIADKFNDFLAMTYSDDEALKRL